MSAFIGILYGWSEVVKDGRRSREERRVYDIASSEYTMSI